MKIIAANKRAEYDYIINEKITAGLVLLGSEVKSLRINTGSIRGSYIIEKNGAVTGEVTCNNIEVYGNFEGIIKASGKVTLYPSAEVKGRVEAMELRIYPGAVLNMDGHTDTEEEASLPL